MTHSILLVDDDPDIVRMMSKMLETEDFNVSCATNQDDGLEMIHRSTPFDVAIIDFWLRSEPPLRILEAIEKRRPDLPVIVMSGGDGKVPLDVSHSISTANGAVRFLQKPFKRNELLSTVRELLT